MVLENTSFSPLTIEATPVNEPEDTFPSDIAVLSRAEVRRINHRLARRNKLYGGLRVHVAYFRVPWPLTRSQYEQYRDDAVDKWLHIMELKGWELKSKVHVNADKRRAAYNYRGDWGNVAMLDQVEIPVAAAFQLNKIRPLGIEVLVSD